MIEYVDQCDLLDVKQAKLPTVREPIPIVRVEALEELLEALGDEYFQQANTQGRLAIERLEQLLDKLKA